MSHDPPLEPQRPGDAARFGRFVIIDEAGSGAMGTVYAAYDPSLDRRVALKVLRGSTDGRRRDRIRREALAMARVSHPNVAPIYEVGEHAGRLFIAMEFVDGDTLDAWQRVRRPWPEVVQMYVAVGDGLVAAHAAGLVHRDFKPHNVLVGRDGRPRIIDFGLARAPQGADGAPPEASALPEAPLPEATEEDLPADLLQSPLTRTGRLLGTPAYMAPEQMAGAPPTPAGDQFAFAVSLYEALFGQPPFPRDSLLELRVAITRGAMRAPPPDHGVPAPVIDALARALAASPADRWPSMPALLAALRRHVADDDLRGGRARALMVALLGVVVLAAVLSTRVIDPPTNAADILRFELVLSVVVLACMVAFRRQIRATEMNRRAAVWVLLMTPAKVLCALMGVVFAVSPQAVHAFDTVLTATMFGVAAFLIRRGLWPAYAFALAATLGIAVWPQWVFQLRDATMFVLPVLVVWVTLRVMRWTPRTPARGVRSPRGEGPEGTG